MPLTLHPHLCLTSTVVVMNWHPTVIAVDLPDAVVVTVVVVAVAAVVAVVAVVDAAAVELAPTVDSRRLAAVVRGWKKLENLLCCC